MSSLSVRALNTLSGLSAEAGALYLRGAVRDELTAYRCAEAWETIAPGLADMALKAASNLCEQQPDVSKTPQAIADDVLAFVRERHFRSYFPDGRAA